MAKDLIPSDQIGRILRNIFNETTGLEEIDGPHCSDEQLIKFAMESLRFAERRSVPYHIKRCRACLEKVEPLVFAYQVIFKLQKGESPETILRDILHNVVDVEESED